MALSEDERREWVQRLKVSYETTWRLFESERVARDLHPGSELARHWLFLSGAYSGAEQTLKYLIATDHGLTIDHVRRWRTMASRQSHLRASEKQVERKHSHHVHELFGELSEETKDVLREHYARFQSLHSYIPIETLDAFLEEVSGPKGSGYTRWRYALIEDSALPKNSAEALLAVWNTGVQVCEHRLWGEKRTPIGVEGRLRIQLCTLFNDAVLKTSVAKQNAGEPYYDIPDEVAHWIRHCGHPLNFFAQCLFHRARYSARFPDDASPWLADALARFLAKLDSTPALNGATPLRQFWIRASGLTPDGLGIEWNPSTRRFENLPWTLPALLAEEPPPGAIRVDAEEGTLRRLRPVLDAARALKLDVRENRAAPRGDTGNHWNRTLEVRAEAAARSDRTRLLSVWERAGDPEFYLAPEVAEDQIPQPLRAVMRAWGNPPKASWIDEGEIVS